MLICLTLVKNICLLVFCVSVRIQGRPAPDLVPRPIPRTPVAPEADHHLAQG